LRDVADDALRWVPKALAATAEIEVEDRGAPDVQASAGQLAQVVLNLLTNALKATRPGSRGKVVLRLGTGNEGQATLEVSDQGVGIAPENRGRIFEPFFTTRPAGVGRGTGLGLAVCHSILASHGGTITVESEVGKGSTFRVELPAMPAEA
jgi:signal transduction histidine kinase